MANALSAPRIFLRLGCVVTDRKYFPPQRGAAGFPPPGRIGPPLQDERPPPAPAGRDKNGRHRVWCYAKRPQPRPPSATSAPTASQSKAGAASCIVRARRERPGRGWSPRILRRHTSVTEESRMVRDKHPVGPDESNVAPADCRRARRPTIPAVRGQF